MAEPATAVAAAVASEARDLADLWSQRSPGTRTQAELTKHARVASTIRTPPKAPAPVGRPTLPGIPATAELVDLLQPPIAPVGVVSEGLQPPLAPPPTLGAILASAPGDQAFTPPGGGGGPHSNPTAQPREELPLTSAVPEPGTWAMMLTGFGLIAWRLRRRRPFAGTARRAAR
ncbi:MAG: PEPxxWA-CTERM sorting domain-containing protein [Sphingomicrobium sp.]